jgi:hypothetical protein
MFFSVRHHLNKFLGASIRACTTLAPASSRPCHRVDKTELRQIKASHRNFRAPATTLDF